MASSDHLLHDKLRHEIGREIDRAIAQLIICDASRHDGLAGEIRGMKRAGSMVDEIVRKWNLDEEAA